MVFVRPSKPGGEAAAAVSANTSTSAAVGQCGGRRRLTPVAVGVAGQSSGGRGVQVRCCSAPERSGRRSSVTGATPGYPAHRAPPGCKAAVGRPSRPGDPSARSRTGAELCVSSWWPGAAASRVWCPTSASRLSVIQPGITLPRLSTPAAICSTQAIFVRPGTVAGPAVLEPLRLLAKTSPTTAAAASRLEEQVADEAGELPPPGRPVRSGHPAPPALVMTFLGCRSRRWVVDRSRTKSRTSQAVFPSGRRPPIPSRSPIPAS